MNDLVRRKGSTLLELLIVIALIAILMGLLFPAVQTVRSSASRLQCRNNLRQVNLGLQQYHTTYDQFPLGYRRLTPDFAGQFWLSHLLPYVDQVATYRLIERPIIPWVPPHPARAIVIPTFGCPSDQRMLTSWLVPASGSNDRVSHTSYLGNSGTDRNQTDGVLFLSSRVRILDVSDGTSSTIIAGERPPSRDLLYGWWFRGSRSLDALIGSREINRVRRYGWYQKCGPGPFEFGPGKIDDDCSIFHYWSLHSGGANFAFADGSVRFLHYSVNTVLPALATRAKGEVVAIPD